MQTLDELFVPSRPLVSAPGTIVHPLTNLDSPHYRSHERPYVVPALSQPQVAPWPRAADPPVDDYEEDYDEDNWDRWDGFPASTDNVGISTISGTHSAGRGRDNPHYQAEGEEGAVVGGSWGELPYYYENYARYSQPPPAYDHVMK